MSRAVIFHRYGGPQTLEVADVPAGVPGVGEVRVRVFAAGVQPFDCLFRSGRAAQWMPASFPQRVGNEFAGLVEAVGEEVSNVAPGMEVCGWSSAPLCYGEHVVVPEGQMTVKPRSMTWEKAGVLSASGQTAMTALRALAVGAGETVLIHAGAGGVGSFAVQIARLRGARVIATASPRNHSYLASLGAEPIEYGPGLAERARALAPDGVDVALDASGSDEALETSLQLVNDSDCVATVAFSPTAAELGIRRLSTERSAAQLAELAELYEAGRLQIEIQQAYPLQEAPEAHRVVEAGHVRGKLVLTT